MHLKNICLSGVVLASLALPARAELEWTNRISLSARLGFDIKASFAGLDNLPVPVVTRLTPDGSVYNYDDGYVLTDIRDNVGGQTWNWGYDASSRQVSGDNILLSRNTGTALSDGAELDDEPSWGGEVVYQLMTPHDKGFMFGLELAGSYQRLSFSDSSQLSAGLRRLTSPFAFTPGTTPPTATEADPYQGTFEGPGFEISDTPGSSVITVLPDAAALTGHRELEGDLWGGRLGPVLQVPIGDRLNLTLSAGLAVGYLDAKVAWEEAAVVGDSTGPAVAGKGSEASFLSGYYLGGTVIYELSSRWGLQAGAQYQSLQDFSESFGGRKVEVNLQESIFVTLGIGFAF